MADEESRDGWPSAGDGEACTIPDVGVDSLPDPPAMPRSVASLYFRIFALDMRDVKWNTCTEGAFEPDMSVKPLECVAKNLTEVDVEFQITGSVRESARERGVKTAAGAHA